MNQLVIRSFSPYPFDNFNDDLNELISSFLTLGDTYNLMISCKGGKRLFLKYGIKNFRSRVNDYLKDSFPDWSLETFFNIKFPCEENKFETCNGMYADISLYCFKEKFTYQFKANEQGCGTCSMPLVNFKTPKSYPFPGNTTCDQELAWKRTISKAESNYCNFSDLFFIGKVAGDGERIGDDDAKCKLCERDNYTVSVLFRHGDSVQKIGTELVEFLWLTRNGLFLNIKDWSKYKAL